VGKKWKKRLKFKIKDGPEKRIEKRKG